MTPKIYTRLGDKGKTGLASGERVEKDDIRVEAYGSVDELNSVIGWCLPAADSEKIRNLFIKLQKDLLVLGADLATPPIGKWANKVRRIDDGNVEFLEQIIDTLERDLPPLKQFLLPGGTELSCRVHIARVVCRRAERNTVKALRERPINPIVVRYLNRLSDLLFVLARFINLQSNTPEKTADFKEFN